MPSNSDIFEYQHHDSIKREYGLTDLQASKLIWNRRMASALKRNDDYDIREARRELKDIEETEDWNREHS